MAKETKYFPHDYNARNDEKTASLIAAHGALGYGVYWIIAELLHEDKDCTIEFEDKKLKRLAAPLKIDFALFKQILDDCIELFELFELRHGYLTSKRVVKNKERITAIIEKKKEAGRKGGEANASRIKADASKNEADASKIEAQVKQNEANKTKLNKTKEDTTIKEPPLISPFHDLDELKEKVIKDNNFLETFYRIGITKTDWLYDWLEAFNRFCKYTGKVVRQETEYRQHFGNWIKFQPYKTQSGKDYEPIKQMVIPVITPKTDEATKRIQEKLAQHKNGI